MLLAVYLGVTWLVNRHEARRVGALRAKVAEQPLDRKGGFQLVMREKYLRWIALLVLLLNAVNTTGEYILSRFVSETAAAFAPTARRAFIGEFYGSYFAWVSLMGVVFQIFLVSRIIQRIGVYYGLFVLPGISLLGNGLLIGYPILGIVRVAKVLENSTDYSLNNTARQALFLTTSREAKFKSKAAIDTFFTRAGDLISFCVVLIGRGVVNLSVGGFATVNMLLTLLWLTAAAGILRERKDEPAPPASLP